MITTKLRSVGLEVGVLLPVLLMASGCSSVLDVDDPDILEREEISGTQGADLVWGGGLKSFSAAFGGSSASHAHIGALFTDEYHNVSVDGGRILMDLRNPRSDNYLVDGIFRNLNQARVMTKNAAEFMEEVDPGDPRTGEMWNLNGFAYLMLGEDFCSGIPVGQLSLEGEVVLGMPMSTLELFETAVSRFETALVEASGDADQESLARVGLGRALLNLGRSSEAALAVANVPTGWTYTIPHGTVNWNIHFNLTTARYASLSDREGGTGLPFRSANDPRLPWAEAGVGVDGKSTLFAQLKFTDQGSPITLASGLEARYIQAEAALEAGDVAAFLEHVNEVRDALGMGHLSDPGTTETRVDLLFYERGFTLFGEGHRLGDMRRLVRQYGRDSETVFPTGAYHLTGYFYEEDVNLPLPDSERDNPNFVGCFDRGA